MDDKIILPIYLETTFKYKKIQKKQENNMYITPINFNEWRLMNRFSYSKIKSLYYENIIEQLEWKTFKTPVSIVYNLYYKNISSDLNNWVSMVDKFFCDCLQKSWCIEDDTVLYIIETIHRVIWQDRDNPRIEVLINPIEND